MAKKELKETHLLTIEQYDNGFTIKDATFDIAEVVEVPQGEKQRLHNSSAWHKKLGEVIAKDIAVIMDAALSNVAEITYTIKAEDRENEQDD